MENQNRKLFKGSHLLRKGRINVFAEDYFITTSTYNKLNIFEIKECAEIVRNATFWLEEQKRWQWTCFVIMPNHVHWLIKLLDKRGLSSVMHTFKSFTSKQIKALLLKNNILLSIQRATNNISRVRGILPRPQIWNSQYFDHRIRKSEKWEQIIWYCYRNPYKANLIRENENYPFWYCKDEAWKLIEEQKPLLLKLEQENKLWTSFKEK